MCAVIRACTLNRMNLVWPLVGIHVVLRDNSSVVIDVNNPLMCLYAAV